MKKLVILVFNVLLLFSLCGCSSTVYTVEEDGKTYEVNHETNTIYDGKYTYEFTYSGNSSSYHIDITYPNGATYTESCEDGSGLVGGSEGYDEEGYESPSQLCYLIMHKESLEIPASKIWGVVFF